MGIQISPAEAVNALGSMVQGRLQGRLDARQAQQQQDEQALSRALDLYHLDQGQQEAQDKAIFDTIGQADPAARGQLLGQFFALRSQRPPPHIAFGQFLPPGVAQRLGLPAGPPPAGRPSPSGPPPGGDQGVGGRVSGVGSASTLPTPNTLPPTPSLATPAELGATAEQVRQHAAASGPGATPEEVRFDAAQHPTAPPPPSLTAPAALGPVRESAFGPQSFLAFPAPAGGTPAPGAAPLPSGAPPAPAAGASLPPVTPPALAASGATTGDRTAPPPSGNLAAPGRSPARPALPQAGAGVVPPGAPAAALPALPLPAGGTPAPPLVAPSPPPLVSPAAPVQIPGYPAFMLAPDAETRRQVGDAEAARLTLLQNLPAEVVDAHQAELREALAHYRPVLQSAEDLNHASTFIEATNPFVPGGGIAEQRIIQAAQQKEADRLARQQAAETAARSRVDVAQARAGAATDAAKTRAGTAERQEYDRLLTHLPALAALDPASQRPLLARLQQLGKQIGLSTQKIRTDVLNSRSLELQQQRAQRTERVQTRGRYVAALRAISAPSFFKVPPPERQLALEEYREAAGAYGVPVDPAVLSRYGTAQLTDARRSTSGAWSETDRKLWTENSRLLTATRKSGFTTQPAYPVEARRRAFGVLQNLVRQRGGNPDFLDKAMIGETGAGGAGAVPPRTAPAPRAAAPTGEPRITLGTGASQRSYTKPELWSLLKARGASDHELNQAMGRFFPGGR